MPRWYKFCTFVVLAVPLLTSLWLTSVSSKEKRTPSGIGRRTDTICLLRYLFTFFIISFILPIYCSVNGLTQFPLRCVLDFSDIFPFQILLANHGNNGAKNNRKGSVSWHIVTSILTLSLEIHDFACRLHTYVTRY